MLYCGCGFNNIYPSQNEKLFYRIIQNGGAIITEYLMDEMPKPINFPYRNRLVAAISDGILVPEARMKSGSLITANYARKLGRKIFVPPSNLDEEKSKGSSLLLKNSAKCVTDVKDLLIEYPQKHFKVNKIDLSNNINKVKEEYKGIYKILQSKEKNIDEIFMESKESISKTNYLLTMMEIEGLVKQLPNKYFKIIN